MGRELPLFPKEGEVAKLQGALFDRILKSRQANPAADIFALEWEIDQLVYRLCRLTEEEIGIVEGR